MTLRLFCIAAQEIQYVQVTTALMLPLQEEVVAQQELLMYMKRV